MRSNPQDHGEERTERRGIGRRGEGRRGEEGRGGRGKKGEEERIGLLAVMAAHLIPPHS